MKVIVLSLGGSVIIPKDKNDTFLLQFMKVMRKHYRTYKFCIVCGGGTVARGYQQVLKKEGKSEKEQSLAGIRATRMNAEFVMQVLGKESNDKLPMTMPQVKSALEKNKVVVCGALRYAPKQTSDSTAAKLAAYLKGEFINVTNVDGLYTSNPVTHKDAKFVAYQTWEEFAKRADKIKFHPGQHFVLDQKAAKIIKQEKIKTYIVGKSASNLDKLLKQVKFKGTTIGP